MAQSERNSSDDTASELSLDIDVDNIPDAVLVADPDTGRIVKANTAAAELFGCHHTELIGCHQRELHPSDDGENYTEAFQRAIDSERVNRLQNDEPMYIEALDGQHIPVEINAQRVETSTGVFILGVFREITAQLDRKHRLEATTSRLETLLDALPVPAAVLDTDATVERWNQAAETTFGYTADSVIGKPYPLFIEDGEFEQLIAQIVDGGILSGYETTHRAEDGSRVPVELYARPLYENNTLTGIIGTAVDLSGRQQRKQQLDVLHRVLRHNLRNNLTIITGWTKQLTDDTGQQQKGIEKIDEASNRLITLSEQAKRIRTGLTGDSTQPVSIPITEVVSRLSEQVTERETATIQVTQNPETGAISRQGLQAVSEVLDSVLTYTGEATLELAIRTHDRHVDLELGAPVPILSQGAQSFISTGKETALNHGNGLAVAKAYLMVKSVGGEVTMKNERAIPSADTLIIELPRVDGSY